MHKKLEIKVKFKEWTVMSIGDTYMHVNREREPRPGCTVIRPNGKYHAPRVPRPTKCFGRKKKGCCRI